MAVCGWIEEDSDQITFLLSTCSLVNSKILNVQGISGLSPAVFLQGLFFHVPM
jgi:hypothetical protein